MKKIIVVVLVLLLLAFWYLWRGEEPVAEAPSDVNSYSENVEYNEVPEYIYDEEFCKTHECKG